jgi:phosphoglycolate phosphatase
MTYLAVFDLDGTLIDTPGAIVETFTATFVSMGAEPPDASIIRATIGLPLEQAFGKLMGVSVDDTAVTRGVQQYQVLSKELILPRAEKMLFPGVVDGLATLRSHGIALAVATSKFYASADALLRAAGLEDRFAMVIGADQVIWPKPNPEMCLVIMGEFGVSAESAVMVGDTTHDLLMAKAANMRSIAVTYGVHSVQELKSANPTWMVDTFDEVVKCVQSGYARQTDVIGRDRPFGS